MNKAAIDLYQALTTEWNRKPQDLNKCSQYLNQLKVIIQRFIFH